eukprot:jgi/Bigna1/86451/estExt_fgenesh1_pg.C_100278
MVSSNPELSSPDDAGRHKRKRILPVDHLIELDDENAFEDEAPFGRAGGKKKDCEVKLDRACSPGKNPKRGRHGLDQAGEEEEYPANQPQSDSSDERNHSGEQNNNDTTISAAALKDDREPPPLERAEEDEISSSPLRRKGSLERNSDGGGGGSSSSSGCNEEGSANNASSRMPVDEKKLPPRENTLSLDFFDSFRFGGASSSKGPGETTILSSRPSLQLKRSSASGSKVSSSSSTSSSSEKNRNKKLMTASEIKAHEIKKWAPLRDLSLPYESIKFQLLIGAIMSKQTQFTIVCKAIRTMKENSCLCKDGKSLDAATFSVFDEVELRRMIRFVHYNKQKAKHIIQTAKMIMSTFRGQVPTIRDQLMRLPGIGPMLANLVRNVTPSKSECCCTAEQTVVVA